MDEGTTHILGVAERGRLHQYRNEVFDEIFAINEELRIMSTPKFHQIKRIYYPKNYAYRDKLKLKLTRLRGIAEGIDFVWCQLKEGSHNERSIGC